MLGETFPLAGDIATWREFLLRSRPHLDGYLSHFEPAQWPAAEHDRLAAQALFRAATEEFLRLREPLRSAQGEVAVARAS